MDTKFRMSSGRPAQKVWAATIGAAVSTIIIWILNTFVLKGTPIPPEVTGAITVIITFLAGYITPPAAQDQIIPATAPQPAGH